MNAQTPSAVDTNLIRVMMNAAIQWFADSGITRMHFVCDATMFDVGILADQVNPLGQIVLNLSANATKGFKYDDYGFSFHCGAKGQDVFLTVPYEAVLGMNVPFGEEGFMVGLPLPNLERHILEVSVAREQRAYMERHLAEKVPQLEQDELPPGAQAVTGVDDHDGDMLELPEDFPTIQQLMKRQPLDKRPKPAPQKETPKPLLDFGALPGEAAPKVQPRPRRVGAPHLTLIQGGKA